MKIRVTLIFLLAGFLSAQGLSDYEILDIEINENMIVVGSKAGVNWKDKDSTIWHKDSLRIAPFGAKIGANLDNIVLGGESFAVRLELKNDSTVLFGFQNKSEPNKSKLIEEPFSKTCIQLFGYDGFFEEKSEKFYFAAGDGGIVVLDEDLKIKKIETDFIVNSIINDNGLTALSPDGKIMRRDLDAWENIGSLKLESSEYAVKFVKGTDNSPFFILTIDTAAVGNEALYAWDGKDNKRIYYGSISKAAVTPDDFIYILDNDGHLVVCGIDGKQNKERRDILLRRIDKTNVSRNYKLTDISIFKTDKGGYSIGFASNKGVFYSKDAKDTLTPFEYHSKAIPIKKGLKEVYAEPGIITSKDGLCSFEYLLSESDRVTIDIFNYNLDFVCRIVENVWREAGSKDEHSTNRIFDKWDGTINNNGGRVVAPGVYYFKITTLKGQKATGKVVVAKE